MRQAAMDRCSHRRCLQGQQRRPRSRTNFGRWSPTLERPRQCKLSCSRHMAKPGNRTLRSRFSVTPWHRRWQQQNDAFSRRDCSRSLRYKWSSVPFLPETNLFHQRGWFLTAIVYLPSFSLFT
jgi:hypothetical protein